MMFKYLGNAQTDIEIINS